ncbi:hypothetical protein AB205_0086560 [Aquarana catesbeiana]|uniref:Uncharacterized protein n=1 Tax=Aquarana catesbeiana TaxID=8400 RepID=A0A2G9SGH4_AQUCT|nr:hypothetical protein AB205_0086560 [Aquarana catesbeiana]
METHQRQQEEEEGDVVEIVTTGGRDVVDPGHFTSESAQILIGEIMGCNRDLENIQKNINDVQKKMKNIIDVLGRV